MRRRIAVARRGRYVASWLAIGLLLAACDLITDPPSPPAAAGPIVSDPVASRGSGAGQSGAGTVYVSLPPGTVREGELARLRVARTGARTMTAMSEGGFDPTALDAAPDDTVWVEVELSSSSTPHLLALRVPVITPPRVVRTSPPRGKRDVVLNDVITIVFSEPVDPSTVEPGTVRLLRGVAVVSAELRVSPDGLSVELRPDGHLAPNAEHRVLVTRGVRDRQGEALEPEYSAAFTTGTTVLDAAISGYPAALLDLGGGRIRTFEFAATRDLDGRVSGHFRGYNPIGGNAWAGRVTCFTIVEGRTAWIAGVIDEFSDSAGRLVGSDAAWKAADYGASDGDRSDELSLMVGLTVNGLGSAPEYCGETPDLGIGLTLVPLYSGEITIRAPAAGPAVGLAFTAQPANAPPGRPMEPVRVAVVDAHGETVTSFAGTIGLTLGAVPGGGSLEGVTVAQPVAGVAEFSGLSVSDTGAGYVLTASADGIAAATSEPFEIVAVGPGRIAFFTHFRSEPERDGLYVMDSDGSGLTRISPYRDLWPAWSPDGTQVAVQRESEPAIYVMNADGSGARRVHTGGLPSWSPTGSAIAFSSDHQQPGFYDIYIMNPDGSGVRKVTRNGSSGRPTWSPDGQRLAFVSREDTVFDLWVVDIDGSRMTRLTALRPCLQARDPAWSPDGAAIAFAVDHAPEDWEACPIQLLGIHLVGPDGTGLRRVGDRWSLDQAVAWSPDGNQLVFAGEYDGYGTCGHTIAVRRLDGSGLVRLVPQGCSLTPAWTGRTGTDPPGP